jgi:hypothetical protein
MFKSKKINRKSSQKNRKWKLMIIPKNKDAKKRQRNLRYMEAQDGTKVFVEKLHNYGLYIVSNGTNPGNVKVTHFAENLSSALLLANNQVADIKEKGM